MINKMKRCESCKHYDKKMSNKNWVVCPILPLGVLMSGTSKYCEKYEELDIPLVEHKNNAKN